jgi:hypothetical protein
VNSPSTRPGTTNPAASPQANHPAPYAAHQQLPPTTARQQRPQPESRLAAGHPCTRFRDYDGKTRHVERSGKSRAGAERSLAEAIRDRVRVGGADEITGDTWVAALATAWLGLIAEQHKSPTTAFAYQ